MLTGASTDLCGSIDAGSTPFFEDVRASAITSPTIRSNSYSSKGFYKINSFIPFSNEFNLILHRIEDSTIALNLIHCGGTSIRPLNLREEITSIQYALLRTGSSQSRFHETKIQCICRQGLLLYLVSLSLLNGLPNRSSVCETAAGHLKDELQNNVSENGVRQELRLWLVLVIFTMVCDETQRSWARREFASIVLDSGFHREDAVRPMLMSFFWVERIHRPRFDELWNETSGSKMICGE